MGNCCSNETKTPDFNLNAPKEPPQKLTKNIVPELPYLNTEHFSGTIISHILNHHTGSDYFGSIIKI